MKSSPRIGINMGSLAYGRSFFSIHLLRRWAAGLVACCCLQSAWANEPQAGAAIAAAHAQLLQKAQAGPVRVIVSLRDSSIEAAGSPPDGVAPLSKASDASRARVVREAIARVVGRLDAQRQRQPSGTASSDIQRSGSLKTFTYSPGFTLTVTAAELQHLLADPEVLRISEERELRPQLNNSRDLMGMVNFLFQGYFDGFGQTIAVLDTGVDKSHSFLAGRVVAEACYSTTDGVYTSVCPGGTQEQESVAAGSGVHCNIGWTPPNPNPNAQGVFFVTHAITAPMWRALPGRVSPPPVALLPFKCSAKEALVANTPPA